MKQRILCFFGKHPYVLLSLKDGVETYYCSCCGKTKHIKIK